jgi:hypothetical protein
MPYLYATQPTRKPITACYKYTTTIENKRLLKQLFGHVINIFCLYYIYTFVKCNDRELIYFFTKSYSIILLQWQSLCPQQ